MNDLKNKILLLVNILEEQNILKVDSIDNLNKMTFSEIVLLLKNKLQVKYPNIKVKRVMKSIHYANTFTDEILKQSAFLLEEIQEYLSKNKLIIHDKVVKYGNDKITSNNFIITPISLIEVNIESMIVFLQNKKI